MPYTIDTIAQTINADWLQQKSPRAVVAQILLDSRHALSASDALFFALPGERHDGHDHLAEAYRAGCRQFVVSRTVDLTALPEANVLRVPDTLAALQQLTTWHRSHFTYPVLGITGSNGKTIVKEWLNQLLQDDLDLVRSPKSYNSQIGVPLSVWQMRPEHQLAIFEAGISQPGEMARLAAIIQPTVGLFTNIGPAHAEGFVNDEEKVAEKMRLFASAHTLICCADHPMIAAAANRWEAENPERTLFDWSRSGRPAAIQYEVAFEGDHLTAVTARHQDREYRLSLPFSDHASIENALHCYAFALFIGKPDVRLSRLHAVEMRLELKSAVNRCMLINDAYSNDLASLAIALGFANQQRHNKRLTLILSDILQSGQEPGELYAQVARLLEKQRVHRVLGIGPEIRQLADRLPADISFRHFADTADFLRQFDDSAFVDELILLKGARVFRFEQIAVRIEQKVHKTLLEVDLGAVVHNLQVYHRLLSPGVKMLVMVKAAGYGAGPAELGRLLEFHKVDYLGVAYADEGIELRNAGVRLPILVLNPEESAFDAMYRYQLEPELYSPDMLERLLAYAGREKHIRIHLKLDTGMHRLGLSDKEVPELCRRLKESPNLEVASVFSHLAGSDAARFDDYTHRQAAQFEKMVEVAIGILGYQPIRHLANTGGIVRFPQYHYDMVRLGIGLYGVDGAGIQDQLQVVHTLKASISQIRYLIAGETVGYNRSGRLERDARIATVSIGYADGLLRLAGNGRFQVNVRGRLAPTVGNICMDMTMIDVTDIPDAAVGDEVIIFGEHPPVSALAQSLQTIPYEVFTNISERVKRTYFYS